MAAETLQRHEIESIIEKRDKALIDHLKKLLETNNESLLSLIRAQMAPTDPEPEETEWAATRIEDIDWSPEARKKRKQALRAWVDEFAGPVGLTDEDLSREHFY